MRRPAAGVFGKIASKFRGVMVAGIAKLKPLPATSAVHIARAASYDDAARGHPATQFEHFRAAVPLAGKRVVLKPNLVEYHRTRSSTPTRASSPR